MTVRKIDTSATKAPQAGASAAERVDEQPAAAPKPGSQSGRRPATTLATVPAANEDPIEALLAIINKLERQLEDERATHRKELAAKDEEIAEARQQNAKQRALDPRVAAVIERFSNE